VFSPDASVIRLDRWQALSPEDRRGFTPLCPVLVVKLASPAHRIASTPLPCLMLVPRALGCRCSWLRSGRGDPMRWRSSLRHFIDQNRWKASKSADKLASAVGLHGVPLEMILAGLPECLLQLQAEGRQCVSSDELRHRLGVSKVALAASLTRQLRNGALARLYPGFYVLLRPEDRVYGLPDPLRWLDPLMAFLGSDYRVSLWRSAALHGSSHQAAMAAQRLLSLAPMWSRSF